MNQSTGQNSDQANPYRASADVEDGTLKKDSKWWLPWVVCSSFLCLDVAVLVVQNRIDPWLIFDPFVMFFLLAIFPGTVAVGAVVLKIRRVISVPAMLLALVTALMIGGLNIMVISICSAAV